MVAAGLALFVAPVMFAKHFEHREDFWNNSNTAADVERHWRQERKFIREQVSARRLYQLSGFVIMAVGAVMMSLGAGKGALQGRGPSDDRPAGSRTGPP